MFAKMPRDQALTRTQYFRILCHSMKMTVSVQALIRYAKSRAALAYLINHEAGLRRYCDDGRLPISNILTEHVAKTIAIARKYGKYRFM
jgi:hypothetical protein